MSITQQNILVSDHITWELNYEESECSKNTRLEQLAFLVVSIAAWPIFFISGAVLLTGHSFIYFNSRWNQSKRIKVLTNKESLEKYAEKRIQWCDKQIEDLKSQAIDRMADLKNPSELGLVIPQKKESYFSSSATKKSLKESQWKDFSWTKFLNSDSFQKPNNSVSPDKKTLQHLEKTRAKLQYLSNQKEYLSNLEGNEKLEAIKKIAELSFVKNGFRKQESKEWITRTILWLLPSGIFWDAYLRAEINHRLTYEGKKHFLPSTTNLNTYADLVDAHNQLVINHKFLVPYINTMN